MKSLIAIKNQKVGLLLISLVLFIFLIPVVLSLLGVINWSLLDFLIAGLLLFCLTLIFFIALKFFKKPKRKWFFLLLVFAVFLLIWIELAVGLFSTRWAGN